MEDESVPLVFEWREKPPLPPNSSVHPDQQRVLSAQGVLEFVLQVFFPLWRQDNGDDFLHRLACEVLDGCFDCFIRMQRLTVLVDSVRGYLDKFKDFMLQESHKVGDGENLLSSELFRRCPHPVMSYGEHPAMSLVFLLCLVENERVQRKLMGEAFDLGASLAAQALSEGVCSFSSSEPTTMS